MTAGVRRQRQKRALLLPCYYFPSVEWTMVCALAQEKERLSSHAVTRRSQRALPRCPCPSRVQSRFLQPPAGEIWPAAPS